MSSTNIPVLCLWKNWVILRSRWYVRKIQKDDEFLKKKLKFQVYFKRNVEKKSGRPTEISMSSIIFFLPISIQNSGRLKTQVLGKSA